MTLSAILAKIHKKQQVHSPPERTSCFIGSGWYVEAMEELVQVIQALSRARTLDEITAIVRDAARNLTGADGASFVLRDHDQCYYADENAIEPLWKGKRFPMSACVSGWVMNHAQSVMIPDIYQDPRVPYEAYRPTFVKSMAMVPIRRNAPIGAIGNYWAKQHTATDEEIAVLQALADTTSVALQNVELYEDLQGKIDILQQQQVRINAQRDALDIFTRALAHDLKEPVRAMQSFTEMLREPGLPPEKSDEYLGFVQKAADRMGGLIQSVFLYTQLDDPSQLTKQEFLISDAVAAAQENLTRLIQEHHAVVTHDPLPRVTAGMPQLTQVFQNLIANAIQHGKENPTVHIAAEEKPDHWLFSVRDNGAGISPEYVEKIFLPFRRLTNQAANMGLGLSICKKVIELHGGSIWCKSAVEQGTTVFFTLPKATATMNETISSDTKNGAQDVPENLPLANILIVDDLESDIELTRVLLIQRAKLQCNLMVAHDADEALRILHAAEEAGEGIDLMLLDINMPGMDGFELIETLRKYRALRHVAVVMCTGSAYKKDERRAELLGAMGYMVKPPSLDKLKPMLNHIVTLRLDQQANVNRLLRVS